MCSSCRMLNICLENVTKTPVSTQQYSSGKIKKEGIRMTTFENIVYGELLWNGCHFHAGKQFHGKGRKLVPPGRRSTSAPARRSSLSLLPDLSLCPAGSNYKECISAVSTAHSFLPCVSPENGKTFQMGKRRGHRNWNSVAALQCEAEYHKEYP